ncbi:transglycosylase domain-containing protein [Diplocloster agilis]|uniref:Penicillin-binding protein 1A n=1 Tax=Diplocloster agilis TaxID=2850323 RepID=A0A949NF32_9FIRM|nr:MULTISPECIES: transglycosylase domain-containing protein [Lachnospiraceae]MBU9737926.1 transglycosylase domain-containing protein [Diplocloster agilis]MBU9746633.1 transglycosylase domain-containing protein [Diplocloster agilis]MCU6732729.1 transglycosylase domain-containing protein [Suonthocola fibrivorans]SCI58462.1 Penicillin-binding protein 1A [uncultured Clostridium sp.]
MNYGKKGVSRKQKKLTSKSAMVGKKLTITFFKAFLVGLVAVAVVLICAGIGVLKGVIDSAPDISNIDISPNRFSTFVYDQDGNEITKLVASDSNRISATIEEMPLDLQHAFVAIEDARFYTHNGIDIKGIIRAGFTGIKNGGDFSEGASTITQQLLKNNVFTDWTEESSFSEKLERKIQEQYLAIQLEKRMDKDTILENYLNTINLGQNTLGVRAASHRYFDKDVSELNLSESAVLAAITQNPSRFNPLTNPEKNAERRKKVLDNMLEQEYINQQQYDEAMADDVYSRIKNVNDESDESSIYTYFVDELTKQVIADLQELKGYSNIQAYNALYSSGLSIYTTQDPALQKICDEEFANPENYPDGTQVSLDYALTVKKADGTKENHSTEMFITYFKEQGNKNFNMIFKDEEDARAHIQQYKDAVMGAGDEVEAERVSLTPQPQASVVLMDQNTGYVKAIVGGRGEKEASLTLNRATGTRRQPGSTFKVLAAFAPALDKAGMTLATVQDDAPFNYANGRPVSNWYGSGYKGLSTIRQAIEQSMNIVAVKTITDITPQVGFDYLKKFGFDTEESLVEKKIVNGEVKSDIGQALALGGLTNGVTNLELTAAYATIADGGTYTKPIFYTKILDHDGNVLIDNTPQQTTVLKDTTAWLLIDAMRDVVSGSKGTATDCKIPNMDVAGKTGTTTGYKDIWFTGSTPYYTCTVWGGYDIGGVELPSRGIYHTYHKKMWKSIMTRVHENLEPREFERPDGIVTASVCRKSGKLAVPGLCDADPRGSMIISEYFAKGTVPTDSCDVHVQVLYCMESGMIANQGCPNVEPRICIRRPDGDIGVTDDTPYELPDDIAAGTCVIHGGESSYIPPADSGQGNAPLQDSGGNVSDDIQDILDNAFGGDEE